MTAEWLEAQAHEEQKLGVITMHSLKSKVNIKVFKNLKFCITNVYGIEKNKLLSKVKDLGGQSIT